MPARNLATSLTSGDVPRNGILELCCPGKSEIKRAAILPESRCADGPSGSAAINEANLCVAISRDTRANSAASSQGSIPNRASAESTLSGTSFLPSPIGANRKSSNSDVRAVSEVRAISTVKLRKRCRTVKPTKDRLLRVTKQYCTMAVPRAVRRLHWQVGQPASAPFRIWLPTIS